MRDPELHFSNHQKLLRVPRRRIQRAVARAFRLAQKPPRQLSLVVVNDREIRRLHREFLGVDRATDVISFPLDDGPSGPGKEFALPLGEVVASAETALREARRRGHPPTFELTLYFVHGVLHLLGHDDHSDAERRAMRAAERRCLAAAGIERDLFPSIGRKICRSGSGR